MYRSASPEFFLAAAWWLRAVGFVRPTPPQTSSLVDYLRMNNQGEYLRNSQQGALYVPQRVRQRCDAEVLAL